MQQYDLPDAERRNELEGLLNNLERAREYLSPHSDAVPDEAYDELEEADLLLSEVINVTRNELDSISEWDDQLVQDLVLDHADRSETTVERLDNAIVFRFSVGPVGDETDLRFELNVLGDNKWLHEKRDGEWEEVWSN